MHCASQRVLVQQQQRRRRAEAFVNIKTHCFGTQEKCSAEICVIRNGQNVSAALLLLLLLLCHDPSPRMGLHEKLIAALTS